MRNYNILKNMAKINKKVEYILVLESSKAKLIPDADKFVNDIKKSYEVKFIKLPQKLEKFTLLHYAYIDKLSDVFDNIIEKDKIDLLYIPHEIDWWILAACKASRGNIPWTALLHTMPLFVCTIDIKKEGSLSTLLNAPSLMYKPFRITRGLYRFFRFKKVLKALEDTLSLAVSKSVARDLRIFYPWLKIEILNPGVGIDLSYISSIQPSTMEFDAIYFTSELIPQKGFLQIPKIWRSVVEHIPDAKLLVVGKGYREYLKEFFYLVEKFNLKKNIVLLDLLPHNKLISLVKSSKLMVYPSIFDSFAMVVLESLACGVPVVAYNIPAIRLNYETDSVIKCPVGNIEHLATSIVALLLDDKLRRNLSREALIYATKFGWKNVAKKEYEAYQKVLDYWSAK